MTIRGDEPLSAGSSPDPESARRLAGEAGAPSGGAADGPGGGGPSAGGFPADGLPADDAYGQSATDPVGNGRADDLPADDPANDMPDRVLPADAPPNGGFPADSPTDDPADDGLADGDGGGVSPVVREYVEGLRREALARDAELRARGIDPYKGTPVDEGPRRRLGARALVALVVLVVAAVSVGAYVVFLRGEPDYGMSHGYQVQSDGSLKRPPITDKAPDKPAEMSKGDEAGAAAAARYYLNASSYAWNTGDTNPLKSISDEECAFCRDQRSKIEEFYAHGYWAAGAHSSITNTQAIEREGSNYEGDVYLVQFRIDERLAEGYTSKGFQESQSRDTVVIFRVGWDGSNWRVLEGRAANAEDAM